MNDLSILTDDTSPPTYLKLILKSKAYKYQSEREGRYYLIPKLINDYKFWLQQNGNNAIWFNKEAKNWVVGAVDCLGGTKFCISGPNDNCLWPSKIHGPWKFKTWTGWRTADQADIQFKEGTHQLNDIN